MKKTRIAALVAGTALAALSVGCGDAANTNTVNANRVNSNTAVVVNSNNANTVVNANNTSGSAYNRNYNARGDYDRDVGQLQVRGQEQGRVHRPGSRRRLDSLQDARRARRRGRPARLDHQR